LWKKQRVNRPGPREV